MFCKQRFCKGEETKTLQVYRRKPAHDQVTFTDCVAIVTDLRVQVTSLPETDDPELSSC